MKSEMKTSGIGFWLKKRVPVIILLLVSLVVALLSGLISATVNSAYLKNHSLYGDTAAYYYLQCVAYLDSKFMGKWEAIKNQFFENSRNPFRLIPIIWMNPDWLIEHNGHLITTSLMLFAYLFFFGWIIYRRCGSLFYALSGVFLILVVESLFDPVFGLGGNYCDLPASFLLGAALFALLNSDEAGNWKMLICSGFFVALTALSRFVAAGYTAVICGPILLYFLIKRWRQKREFTRAVLFPVLVFLLPIVVFSGFYFFNFTLRVLNFYSLQGYALNTNLSQVISDFIRLFPRFPGITGFAVLMLLAFFYFSLHFSFRKNWSELILTIWAAAAQIILVVFVLKVGDDWLPLHYIYPGLFLLSFAPFSIDLEKIRNIKILPLHWKGGVVLMLIFLGIGWSHYRQVQRKIAYPTPEETKRDKQRA